MSPQQVFSIVNSLALVSWIMLAILPRRPWVTKVVTTKFVPGLFAILYTAIVVSLFWRSPGGFSTLASVGVLFSNPWLLLAGWVHYLAFDLLIGSWELEDSRERGIPHLMVVPCLLLTFMFGPAGWLLYRIVRSGLDDGNRKSQDSFRKGGNRSLPTIAPNPGIVGRLSFR